MPSSHSNGSETLPPKHPHRLEDKEPSVERTEPVHSHGNHTHAPIVPYSATNRTSVDSSHQSIDETHQTQSQNHPIAMATISPPALSPLAGEEEEEVLGKVTEVIKAVMELSNHVALSPPDQYIDLVKVSHMTCHMTAEL